MRREYYRFTVSVVSALAITIVHVGTAAYLWFSFRNHPAFTEEINTPEVSLPLTVAYVVSITKWFIDTKGIRNSEEIYGLPFVIFIALVVGSFLLSLPLGPYLYLRGDIQDAATLNSYYLFVESVLGGMYALLFSEMFSTAEKPIGSSASTHGPP